MEIKKKEFTYRGKTIEELKGMDTREFAKYLKSRKRRSLLRNFQKIEEFVNESKEKTSKNKPIKTHLRSLIVVPKMIGMKIQIYNGKSFIPIELTGETLGHSFGEFSLTRARIKHGKSGIGATKGTKHKAKK